MSLSDVPTYLNRVPKGTWAKVGEEVGLLIFWTLLSRAAYRHGRYKKAAWYAGFAGERWGRLPEASRPLIYAYFRLKGSG